MSRENRVPRPRGEHAVDHLLGQLEVAIMRRMWAHGSATVRDIRQHLQAEGRQLAYTTVMTVMSRLAVKGLLTRTRAGKTHVYHVALTEAEFLHDVAAQRVQGLIEEFGDLAIVQFLATVDELSPERRRQLERLAGGEVS